MDKNSKLTMSYKIVDGVGKSGKPYSMLEIRIGDFSTNVFVQSKIELDYLRQHAL